MPAPTREPDSPSVPSRGRPPRRLHSDAGSPVASPRGHTTDGNRTWERAVADSAHVSTTRHAIAAAGPPTIRIHPIDTGLTLHPADAPPRPSYLGPPESPCAPASPNSPHTSRPEWHGRPARVLPYSSLLSPRATATGTECEPPPRLPAREVPRQRRRRLRSFSLGSV